MNDLPVGRSVDETLRLVQAFKYTDKHGEVTKMIYFKINLTLGPDYAFSSTWTCYRFAQQAGSPERTLSFLTHSRRWSTSSPTETSKPTYHQKYMNAAQGKSWKPTPPNLWTSIGTNNINAQRDWTVTEEILKFYFICWVLSFFDVFSVQFLLFCVWRSTFPFIS